MICSGFCSSGLRPWPSATAVGSVVNGLSIIVTRAANRPVTTLNVVTANGAIPQPLRRFWITMMSARIEEIHVQSSSEPPWPAHMAAIL